MTLQAAEPRTKRWTRDEYYRLGEEGYFRGQRVQLIDGEIIQMPPQGHAHAKALSRAQKAMEAIFGGAHWIRTQMPLNVGTNSDPEPDIAVTTRPMNAYTDHPTTALIVIEIADSSLHLDRGKAALYAKADVKEYWIVDVNARHVEVYRLPATDAGTTLTSNYSPPVLFRSGQQIDVAGSKTVAVDELLS